jgi:hypothetical protein
LCSNDKRPTMLKLAWNFPKPRRGINSTYKHSSKTNHWIANYTAAVHQQNGLPNILPPPLRRLPAKVASLRTFLPHTALTLKHQSPFNKPSDNHHHLDLHRLPRQQHPSLLLPRRLPTSLRRHHALARHTLERPHIRHLDGPQLHHPPLRRLPHQQPGRVRDYPLDLWHCFRTLCAGVVGLWDCEVGEGVGGPVGCEYGYGELDGGAVGIVCEVRVLMA